MFNVQVCLPSRLQLWWFATSKHFAISDLWGIIHTSFPWYVPNRLQGMQSSRPHSWTAFAVLRTFALLQNHSWRHAVICILVVFTFTAVTLTSVRICSLNRVYFWFYGNRHQYLDLTGIWTYADDLILGPSCNGIGQSIPLGVVNRYVLLTVTHTSCLLISICSYVKSAVRTTIQYGCINSCPPVGSEHGVIRHRYYFGIDCPCGHANEDSSSSATGVNSRAQDYIEWDSVTRRWSLQLL